MLRVTTPTSNSASVKLRRSHSSSFRATRQGSRGTRTPTVRGSLPSRGLGLPSGTSRPSSTSPSRLHQHCVSEGRRRPRRRATAVASSGADVRAISINVSYVAKQ